MLENLHIKNVALIEECQVEFGNGLNILTGETGAGKSMLIDSLQFALGGRTGRDFLRKGADTAVVEAYFTVGSKELLARLDEAGIAVDEDRGVLISRSLNTSGRSVCRVNGSMVTVGMLRELTGELIDFYGQHEHQSLLDPSKHIRILDRFCGDEHQKALAEYATYYNEIKSLDKRLAAQMGDDAQRAQRLDILSFQKAEIEGAQLKKGEEETLLEDRKRLSSMEALIHGAMESIALLYDGTDIQRSACDSLGEAVEELRLCSEIDRNMKGFYEELSDIYARAEDTARELKRYVQDLEDDPAALEETEERLQVIYNLKRKYGGSIEKVLKFAENVDAEIYAITNSEETINALKKQRKLAVEGMTRAAERLTECRKRTADRISAEIEASLRDMEMKNGRFSINITPREDWTALGRDKVEFLISPNLGEDMKPLSKIASGGEMSRVMLALKAVLVDADDIETFIFDEIDTGVSGKTAGRVGRKMSLIGKKRQVLCITHLPQIAAMADTHFLIEKQTRAEQTVTVVSRLDEDGAVCEVARLMGSQDVTEATLAAARELREEKKNI